MFNEIKSGDIPSLSFLKGTNYAMYIGPALNPKQVQLLKSDDIPAPVLYLPEILEQLSDSVLKYNFPGVSIFLFCITRDWCGLCPFAAFMWQMVLILYNNFMVVRWQRGKYFLLCRKTVL